MDELRRRYLKQQAELGGRDVVLEGPTRQAHGVARGTPPAPEPAEAPLQRAPVAGGEARPGGAGTKDWRVGAPAIPGPGLTIARDLLAALPDYPDLAAVAAAVGDCRGCFLCQGRTKVVPGEGNPLARLVLVGEGPGQTEDETGRPFVGKAGELLTGILAAIGLPRSEVFICNVVKCRPPQNRKPLPDEMAACLPYLRAQLDLINPKVIVALGSTAAEALLGVKKSLAELRLKVHSYRGTPLVVTYHPAALLRNPHWKKPTWDDVRIARQLLDA